MNAYNRINVFDSNILWQKFSLLKLAQKTIWFISLEADVMQRIKPQHRFRDHNAQTKECLGLWIVMDNKYMLLYKLYYCILVHRPMSINKSQLRFCQTLLDYVQDNCPVRLLHDHCYTKNWIPQKRESSVAKNAQHGVHCMHASDKTATWCYINFNAMRTVSCIDARQFRPLRPNNIICVIQCTAQSVHVCMKRRSCTSAACAEQAPGHNHDCTTLVQLAAKCAKLSSGMQWQALQNRPIK